MLRYFLSLLFLAGLLTTDTLWAQVAGTVAVAPVTPGVSATSGQMYDQAKFYFNQLENNDVLARSRDNWLKGTRNFRKVYLLNPKTEFAPGMPVYARYHVSEDV